ncbi:MAG: GNAT family N-acetyltransferase [Dichotomicrobium sp.]
MKHEGEFIERASLEAFHAVLDRALADSLRVSWQPVGDGAASVAGALPASAITINRTIGLGLERPVGRDEVAKAKNLYDEAGAKRYFLQLHPDVGRDAFVAACEELGLEKTRGWQKFHRGCDELVPDMRTEFTIREVGPDHGEAFARIVCDGFDLGEVAIPWLARLPGSSGGWRAFMAFDGETPVGTGGLFIKDDIAFTDFGATAPQYRGRGAQSANLAHRVRAALEAGCTRIYTCTGEEVEGDPQHSYANIMKMGFRELYLRENYAPPK